jgi:hypothetical protein
MRAAHSLFAATLLALLAGCAAAPGESLGNAAVTPLNDLNLVKAPIPPVLQAAQARPYGFAGEAGSEPDCVAMNDQVRALDEVLGADLDTPPSADKPSLLERGGSAAGDATVGAVRRTAEGVVPFRGWIRKLTGAERYSRQVAAAITAGSARRAWLKGYAVARGCR